MIFCIDVCILNLKQMNVRCKMNYIQSGYFFVRCFRFLLMIFIELFIIIQNEFGVFDLVVFGFQVFIQFEVRWMFGYCDFQVL